MADDDALPQDDAPAPAGEQDQPERARGDERVDAVYSISVDVIAVLGTATMKVSQILKLGRGAVVELDRKVGEAVDLYANNQLVARGEVVVIEDRLGITLTEIIKKQ